MCVLYWCIGSVTCLCVFLLVLFRVCMCSSHTVCTVYSTHSESLIIIINIRMNSYSYSESCNNAWSTLHFQCVLHGTSRWGSMPYTHAYSPRPHNYVHTCRIITMAFNEAILANSRPNLFELVAQDSMHEALRPAFEYVCKVGIKKCTCTLPI